jgi:hypothetical protein
MQAALDLSPLHPLWYASSDDKQAEVPPSWGIELRDQKEGAMPVI